VDVSQPLGYETSQRENNRLTCTVTDFRRYQGIYDGKGNSRNYVSQPSGENGVLIVSYETGGAQSLAEGVQSSPDDVLDCAIACGCPIEVTHELAVHP
jgi:hypothetical protein